MTKFSRIEAYLDQNSIYAYQSNVKYVHGAITMNQSTINSSYVSANVAYNDISRNSLVFGNIEPPIYVYGTVYTEHNNKIYSFRFGVSSNYRQISIYDVSTNTSSFSSLMDISGTHPSIGYCPDNKKIYAIRDAASTTTRITVYDTSNNTFSAINNISYNNNTDTYSPVGVYVPHNKRLYFVAGSWFRRKVASSI